MPAETRINLQETLAALRQCRWVDLTHAFHPGIPHCSSFEREQRTTLYHYDPGIGVRGHGFLAHEYRLVGQWGTHVDPPAHFARGLRFLDEIPVTEMILDLVVIDIREQAEHDPDYCVSMEDVHAWESRHGRMPANSFVALRSGWSRRWPNHNRMLNRDELGISHFPGWSVEVLRYLCEECGIAAAGHETTDTDPGVVVSRREAPLETYILARNKWQIELMANLEQVPVCGALIVASWPKPLRGSGFPARLFAICPP